MGDEGGWVGDEGGWVGDEGGCWVVNHLALP